MIPLIPIYNTRFSIYADKRVFAVYLLGISSGLPWVMIGSVLTLWLKEAGILRAEIGYAGLIFAVYAINFLWAPIIDQLSLQKLAEKLRFLAPNDEHAARKRWVLLCQAGIVLSCLAMSTLSPEHSAKLLVLCGLLVAVFSATQDIAIDAYRINSFSNSESGSISAAAASATAGWWTGYAGIGFFPLWLSDKYWTWPEIYLLLASVMILISLITRFLPSPQHQVFADKDEIYNHYTAVSYHTSNPQQTFALSLLAMPFCITAWALADAPLLPRNVAEHDAFIPCLIFATLALCVLTALYLAKLEQNSNSNLSIEGLKISLLDRILARVLSSLIAPLKDFFSRNGFQFALAILSFIFLFKIGEAFLGRMSIVFYKEVGFSNTDIAKYSKMLTWVLTIKFAFIAGVLNAKMGLIKGLFISGIAMAGSNLMFALIAQTGPEIPLYIATIVVDGFAAAWSTVAFVSFISLFCNHAFSATQYALLASLGSLSRTTLSAMSGQVVDWLGDSWTLFFILTTIMVIPSLVVLYRLKDKIRALEMRS